MMTLHTPHNIPDIKNLGVGRSLPLSGSARHFVIVYNYLQLCYLNAINLFLWRSRRTQYPTKSVGTQSISRIHSSATGQFWSTVWCSDIETIERQTCRRPVWCLSQVVVSVADSSRISCKKACLQAVQCDLKPFVIAPVHLCQLICLPD